MRLRFLTSIVPCILLTFLLQSCMVDLPIFNTGNTNTGSGRTTTSGQRSGAVLKGEASYYADRFQGKQTASGARYDKNKLTAAHKTLAFGTKVRVRNLKNNQQVTVVINDRLPSTSKREIDLSYKAASTIGMIRDGVVPVEITILP
ncbi:septal ring lytic transglycosylase RlpA family protein [Eisenibacter elegans]|uniref:septal ring lytic transglycosylase RlpA family protein n=1 Tax=Eisenibacter elegans TaxID=997 RepID=UPI001FE0B8EB|nr:septal ring lytic transglycosylase RlpA family protein [Eisenibacter elegans]